MKRTVKYPIPFLPREQFCEREGADSRLYETVNAILHLPHPVLPRSPPPRAAAAPRQNFAGLYVDALA
jgi:hypothetical protein